MIFTCLQSFKSFEARMRKLQRKTQCTKPKRRVHSKVNVAELAWLTFEAPKFIKAGEHNLQTTEASPQSFKAFEFRKKMISAYQVATIDAAEIQPFELCGTI